MEVRVVDVESPPNNINNSEYGNNPVFIQPAVAKKETGCFHRNQKNRPQSNSAGSAVLIFASGGMNIAWSVGFFTITNFKITEYMRMCWFISAIVGAILGAGICNNVQKKYIFMFSSFFVSVGGILVAALSKDPSAIVVSRYIDGFANGLALVTTFVLIGEVAVKSIRGVLASSTESMSFALGIYIQIGLVSAFTRSGKINGTQVQGILSIIFGIASFAFAYFFMIESPILYLNRGQEELAIDALRRLQRPCIVTTETYEQLEEHKCYIAKSNEKRFGQQFRDGMPALMILCLYRALLALSFSIMLTGTLATSSLLGYGFVKSWPFFVYGTMRYLGTIITALLMDSAGRKMPTLLGALVCGCLALGIGTIVNDTANYSDQYSMRAAVILLFVFQFFAGIFVSASSSYLTEAFPLTVKPIFIAIAFCTEMYVQIIVNVCQNINYNIANYYFATGALMLVFLVVAIICLPETKKVSLRDAQDKFHGFINYRN